jgi:NitT/TauT family transport system substrate-binding protein
MRDVKRIAIGAIVWAGAVTVLHAWLNLDWSRLANQFLPEEQRKLEVAYIPVT